MLWGQPRTFLGAGLALGGAAVCQQAVDLAVGGGHTEAVLRLQRPAHLGLASLHLHTTLMHDQIRSHRFQPHQVDQVRTSGAPFDTEQAAFPLMTRAPRDSCECSLTESAGMRVGGHAVSVRSSSIYP